MRHDVILNNSFDKFADVAEDIYESMLSVIQGLERHPFFKPEIEQYIFEDHGLRCSCKHRTDWGEWQLNWVIVADGILTLNNVDAIVVTLSKTTYRHMQILPRK